MKSKQLSLLNLAGLKKIGKSAFGGDLQRTRAGRVGGRPLSTRETMHLVLRSTQAKGEWSFRRAKHFKNIQRIVETFSNRYGVRVLSMANVGNHLHLQIKLGNRLTYAPFIRSVTGAIAQSVTGRTRWKKLGEGASRKFWDYRPFTRIATSLRAFLNLQDYIRINQLEGFGYKREEARFMLSVEKQFEAEPDF